MDLFERDISAIAPLAERMRPKSITHYMGQRHLVDQGKLLRCMIETDRLTSLILWGPPGSGKTTIARIIANATKSNFIFFSAIMSGIKEIREVVKESLDNFKFHGKRTILFVDEIHRFNKSQQDAFLPYVEQGLFTLIGATTENPSFEIISALLSRCKVLVLNPLSEEEIVQILQNALDDRDLGLGSLYLSCADEALLFIAKEASGDARKALNTLEVAAQLAHDNAINLKSAEEAVQRKSILYDKAGEEHYNVISAFIKSMRGSDPNASLYWLARLLEAGEDPIFILRRMVVFASEDVGNADPRGLQIAVSALQGFKLVGMPEGRIVLSQAVSYLACAPKSNRAYLGIDQALHEVRRSGALAVPMHLRNAPTHLMKNAGYGKGYEYPHDYSNGYVDQNYLPVEISDRQFYEPKDVGFEKQIIDRMKWLKKEPPIKE